MPLRLKCQNKIFLMSKSIFQEGGPHNIRRTGQDEYSMRISIPPDEDGYLARECPESGCSPGYFKVKPGTGITDGQEQAFCPYCHNCADPSEFTTKEQIRYAEDIALQEAHKGVGRMIKDAFGLGASGKRSYGGGFLSMDIEYKPKHPPHVRPPFEEEVRRDVVCPHCGLDHSVFGLAMWCPDCGEDIFMSHVKTEYAVVRKMLSDIQRRKDELGNRVAARDIENALEDIVSIFEAVLRVLLRRLLTEKGISNEEIEEIFKKRVRNKFQNVKRAQQLLKDKFNVDLFSNPKPEDIDFLNNVFEKRHPITHNLGVVDKRYLENARTAEKEGRDIRVTAEEIEKAIGISIHILEDFHSRLFV